MKWTSLAAVILFFFIMALQGYATTVTITKPGKQTFTFLNDDTNKANDVEIYVVSVPGGAPGDSRKGDLMGERGLRELLNIYRTASRMDTLAKLDSISSRDPVGYQIPHTTGIL